MNNLLLRSLSVGIASILSFVLVVLVVISAGMPKILLEWENSNNRNLIQTVKERLTQLAADPKTNSLPSEKVSATVRNSLQNLAVRPEYLVVLDAADQTVFINHFGDDPPGLGLNLIHKLQETATWTEIPVAGQRWLRFTTKVLPFDADESNRLLFATLQLTALWGMVAASLIAFLIALVLSRPLSRQARNLAMALNDMQHGKRDVSLQPGGVQELRAIAASVQNLQASLRNEELTRQQWASDIAHDLRTPLTVLKGQFEGMLDGVFAPDYQRLERNYREIQQLERLIGQLAELTRLETPGFQLNCQVCDTTQILAALAGRFSDAATRQGFQLECTTRDNYQVMADSALLERALNNLLDNALRYAEGNSTIRLQVESPRSDTINLVVDNAGIIPPEIIPKLFDRLFRADSSRHSEGSGLRLSIVKAIADAHQGVVSVQSDPETRRTRFILSLPRFQAR